MKIGIISINSHTRTLNFGSMIHSYAFQQFLLKNGVESTIIEYKPVYYGKFNAKHPVKYFTKHPHPDPEKQKVILERWEKLYDLWAVRYEKLKKFQDTYYIKTDKCYTPSKLDKEDPGFDCYICATDVLWKYHKKSGFDKGYFLASDCMKGKKKIAYAASGRVKTYNKAQEIQFLEWISDFDYISVREKSLKKYLRSEAGLIVPSVLDPVFLMPKEFYADLVKEPDYIPKKKYALIYLAMENAPAMIRSVIEFAAQNDLEVIELSEILDNKDLVPEHPHHVICDIGVEEWLWYILHSEYFFTNSFHGCCFSIIFQKRFFAGNRGGGDKIDFLLEIFGLEWRRVLTSEAVLNVGNLPEINYAKIEEIKQREIEASANFILGAIKDLEKREHKPLISDPSPWIERVERKKKKRAPVKKSFLKRAYGKVKRTIKKISTSTSS